MIQIFISVGMSGRSGEEVAKDLARATADINDLFSYGRIGIWHNWYCEDPEPAKFRHESLWYLSNAIEKLGHCDACYFVKGWQNHRGCRIEREICREYGIKIIEET